MSNKFCSYCECFLETWEFEICEYCEFGDDWDDDWDWEDEDEEDWEEEDWDWEDEDDEDW